MLWRNKTRRLQRLYPLGPYKNIGMYAPPLRKRRDAAGFEADNARSDWLKANYHDDFNDFDSSCSLSLSLSLSLVLLYMAS